MRFIAGVERYSSGGITAILDNGERLDGVSSVNEEEGGILRVEVIIDMEGFTAADPASKGTT